MQVEHIEAVIKVTERCNINCDYCYVYHKGNDDFMARPALMKFSEFDKIINFLVQGVSDMGAKRMSVIFHGGEPLLLKKVVFSKFCAQLRERIPSTVSLNLGLQTNAILIDEEWIGLFRQHHVFVSVSLDGPAEIHDRHRRDHRDRGTHAGVVKGLKLLQEAADDEVLPHPGVICVIDPETDARKIYRYFVDDLGFRSLIFHLPMDTHETGGWINMRALTGYLLELFEEWSSDDNPNIRVRMFEEIMTHFLRKPPMHADVEVESRIQHVTISTDGTIGVDELKPTGIRHDVFNVSNTTLLQYAKSDLSVFLRAMYRSIPTDCADCVWATYCGGGSKHGVAVNRWSNASGFNTRSLICESLESNYAKVANYLIGSGLSPEELEDNIRPERYGYEIAPAGPQLPHKSNLVAEVIV